MSKKPPGEGLGGEPNGSSPQLASQFLLAEFNALQERAKSLEEIKGRRVNSFLLVIAFLGALFSTSLDAALLEEHLGRFLLLASVFLLFLGLLTLKEIVDYSVAAVSFHRRAGRIRRWFVDLDNSIKDYVAFHPADDRPNYSLPWNVLTWRGAETILVVFNSISFATATYLLELRALAATKTSRMVLFGVSLVLAWFAQTVVVHVRLKRLETSESEARRIHFPYQGYLRKDLPPEEH